MILKNLFLTIILAFTFSCASRSYQLQTDPRRQGDLSQARARVPVKSPTRQELSTIIKPAPQEPEALAESSDVDSASSQEDTSVQPPQVDMSLPWSERVALWYKANIPIEEKILRIQLEFDRTFNQGNIGIEQMATQLRQTNPSLLEMFDFWLLEKLWDQAKYDEASRFASQLMNSSIEVIQKKAAYLFDQYYVVRRASPRTIGVLLPKENRQSSRFLAAIKMAFGHTEGQTTPYKLVVLEEPEESKDFDKKFEEFIRRENVIAIIGGLSSRSRHDIARLSTQYRVPFVFMGQKSKVTEEGPYIFQYGLTNEAQIRALVAQARAANIRRFAVIYPNDGYGVEAANLFWDEWVAAGGEITAAITYHPQEQDFQELASKLSSKYDLAARDQEYKALQKELIEKDPLNQRRIMSQSPAELLPAIYEYEAIFIPDVPRAMAKITASLAYYGVRRLPVYGTRLWANPEAHRLAGSMWASYLLSAESVYNVPELFNLNHPFSVDYKKQTGQRAEHLEFSAYEVAGLLKEALSKGVDTREGLTRALQDSISISGVAGQPLYFDEYREIDAPVVLLRFGENGRLIPASTGAF